MYFILLFLFFILFLLVSTRMFAKKVNKCLEITEGKLRTKKDLNIVKDVINFNMKTAFFTLIFNFCILISAIIHIFVYKNLIYVLALFLIGLFSFVNGLVCKKYEDKIKDLEIFEIEPDVGRIFTSYLEQWPKRQFSLKEEV